MNVFSMHAKLYVVYLTYVDILLKGHYLPNRIFLLLIKTITEMIDALLKRVSVTYKFYEMYAHRGGGDATMHLFLIFV